MLESNLRTGLEIAYVYGRQLGLLVKAYSRAVLLIWPACHVSCPTHVAHLPTGAENIPPMTTCIPQSHTIPPQDFSHSHCSGAGRNSGEACGYPMARRSHHSLSKNNVKYGTKQNNRERSPWALPDSFQANKSLTS